MMEVSKQEPEPAYWKRMMTDLSDVSDRPGGVGFNMGDREAFCCEAWSGCLLDTIAY